MRIIDTVSEIRAIETGSVLSIGNFDGVHLGHQKILAAAAQEALKRQCPLVVMTFEPHPVAVLQPDKSPGVLTPIELKKSLLAKTSVDTLLVLDSTSEILALSPERFVQRFLVEAIGPSVVVEGEDFNFGAGRAGSIGTLQTLARNKGFEVSVVEAKEIRLSTGQNVRVSSTVIRRLLENGRVADAASALGRAYRLVGQVVPGRGKGKQLGFPTANLEPAAQIIPADGVYAGAVEIADTQDLVIASHHRLPAALSLGRAETLSNDRPKLVEAHLLIENVGQLNGKWLALDFVKRLRSQIKFDTEADLAKQIAKDCKNAKQILDATEGPTNADWQ
jgi:riboflavin kinase/FMN adenylyltransferase